MLDLVLGHCLGVLNKRSHPHWCKCMHACKDSKISSNIFKGLLPNLVTINQNNMDCFVYMQFFMRLVMF